MPAPAGGSRPHEIDVVDPDPKAQPAEPKAEPPSSPLPPAAGPLPPHPRSDAVGHHEPSYVGDAFRVVGLLCALLVGLMAVTLGYGIAAMPDPPTFDPVRIDVPEPEAIIERLRGFLRLPTVCDASAPDHVGPANASTFQAAIDYIEGAYPEVSTHLTRELVNGYTMVYTWPGSDPTLEPALLVSHYDVVPAAASDGWSHDPFDADVVDGAGADVDIRQGFGEARARGARIIARGTLDIKTGVTGPLEGVSLLLSQGFQPKRTVILAFGHEEEVGGEYGAKAVASLLRSRGTRLALVVDEGGTILVDGIGGGRLASGPVAIVGTAEKGYLSLRADILVPEPGHSSMPRTDGLSAATVAADIMAAVVRRPPSGSLAAPTTDMLRHLAHRAPLHLRPLMANPEHWLSCALFTRAFRSQSSSAALTRTTAAVTLSSLGVAENVVPATASVTVNFRILPGVSLDYPAEYLNNLLGKHAKYVTLSPTRPGNKASPITDASGPAFHLLRRAILETLPREGETLTVAPFLLTGMTDSRHYVDLSRGGILRFSPYRVNQSAGDLGMIHGIDESIAVEDVVNGVAFYARLITLLGSEEL